MDMKKEDCQNCQHLYDDAVRCFKCNAKVIEGYMKLVEVMQKQHTNSKHEDIVNKSIVTIAEILGHTQTADIPKFLTIIPCGYYIQVIEKLAENNHWRQLDMIVRQYRTATGTEKLKGFATNMTIVPVIRDETLRETEDLKLQIMNTLVNSGASLGDDGGQTAIQAAREVEHYKVLNELIQHGADTSKLSVRDGDTPVHAALAIVLEKTKALSLLEFVFEKYKKDPDANKHMSPDQLDANGDSLFHIVARTKYNDIALRVTQLLCEQNLSAKCFNLEGKLPIEYLKRKDDKRRVLLQNAAKIKPAFHTSHFAKKEPEPNEPIDDLFEDIKDEPPINVPVTNIKSLYDEGKDIVNDLIKSLPDIAVDSKRKTNRASGKCQSGKTIDERHDTVALIANSKETTDKSEGETIVYRREHNVDMKTGDIQAAFEKGFTREVSEQQNEVQDDTVLGNERDEVFETDEADGFEMDIQIFDNLEWEVECTAEFWKKLKDKHVPRHLKRRIIHKIQMLASGDWQPTLCKKLTNTGPNLRLYEVKFTKGSRILWELAVAFSPRCSETADRRLSQGAGEVDHPVKGGRIYSEIIRVWDIVLDHDKIHRAIERIKMSHKRGEQCIIQMELKGIKSEVPTIPTAAGKCYPRMYAEADSVTVEEIEEHRQEMQKFFPPASANDAEFHILKFYTFSSALVSHVLQNIEVNVDFPFRVTDLEHAIINLSSKAPILLLGRSGTGKTTCCMYRLWSQFHGYWSAANKAGAPLLPRCIEFVQKDAEEKMKGHNGNGKDISQDRNDNEEMLGAVGGLEEEKENEAVKFDHIHQLFITKNAILCHEVQKNFHDLSRAESFMETDVKHETYILPNRLQDVKDHNYPLFITSKQMLLMLDASVGQPHFFCRNPNGSLKVKVTGWTDTEGPQGQLSQLHDNFDVENDDDVLEELDGHFHDVDETNDPLISAKETKDSDVEKNKDDVKGIDDHNDEADDRNARGIHAQTDPRREITYDVFVEEVWPTITKRSNQNCHPALVWMEVMSFIKGSYEALTKTSGCIELEEYVKLGKQRAPNFTGDRATIYQLFRKYEHFKRQHQLFDETDLVHSVYTRLATRNSPSLPWVIHQIYVDETQDFTQAELCLLIRLCQNPNDMFLTGDTAQSIMRGISFRFSDLISLFYYARESMHAMGKASAIEVPKDVYQLTYNYRSHAGILSLASSILDLMVKFFPESFDRLQPDQGLFHGPQPILLESCSFSDLAVLLGGNRRKTSHIEFGAHQAILVVNDASRDAIPEELRLGLVLTIFEAKGLEFDDVLLYNFFKDSQASKEWRVVTQFLDRLVASHQEIAKPCHQNSESLKTIDADILRQKDRSRPLNFDSNKHKVLNSELKHLYTALTRARVNVWIFDEDEDKRKPMFEYFKVRKLVKSVTYSEINESDPLETVFAERSCPEDWCNQGERFMRRNLYREAAKCFRKGKDRDREKVAVAHDQASKASKLIDRPEMMRGECLYAAQLFLECGETRKAAIYLHKAAEAAQLLEKLGEHGRSAKLYRNVNLPFDSSRCYQQTGDYNKAVKVLSESHFYRFAVDVLRKYKTLVNKSEKKIEPPVDETEDTLWTKAAEFYHKQKNQAKMLDALEEFTDMDNRISFLVKYKYIDEAANILQRHDKLAEASQLLLYNGKYAKAIAYAKSTHQEDVIHHTVLVSCRLLLRKETLTEEDLGHLQDFLNDATQLFDSRRHPDKFGEVLLMRAKLIKKNEDLKQFPENNESILDIWMQFHYQCPPCLTGLLEVANLMMQQNRFDNLTVLSNIVESIGHITDICRELVQRTDCLSGQMFLRFYGVASPSETTVKLHPRDKPLWMEIVRGFFDTKKGRDQEESVDRKDFIEKLALSLLLRTGSWLKILSTELENKRNELIHECEDWEYRFETEDVLEKLEVNIMKTKELTGKGYPQSIISNVTTQYLGKLKQGI